MSEIKDKIFYNQASSVKLGWDPSWLGSREIDDEFIKKVIDFQKQFQDLNNDGLIGPATFRRLVANIESVGSLGTIKNQGKDIPIDWKKIKHKPLPNNCWKEKSNKRKIDLFVIHWDAALNSESAWNILLKRGISSHFLGDDDGTIIQAVDLNDIAWHGKPVNHRSIGYEISNAVYLKYQNYYKKHSLGPRPIVEKPIVNNHKYDDILGFYPVQIKALKEVIKFAHLEFNIPLKTPRHTNIEPSILDGTFKGICCHYHFNKYKWDCAGLELDKIVEEVKEEI